MIASRCCTLILKIEEEVSAAGHDEGILLTIKRPMDGSTGSTTKARHSTGV